MITHTSRAKQKTMTETNGADEIQLSRVDRWVYERQSHNGQVAKAELEKRYAKAGRFYRVLLQRYLPKDKESLILDLPCGEGKMVWALKEMGYGQVRGYDLDERRLGVGRKMGLDVYEGEVFEVLGAQEDGSVGGIFSVDFLEHLEKEKVIDYLQLVSAKLKNEGVFVVRMPCADSPYGGRHIFNDFSHKWAATSGVLKELLKGAGFEKVEVFGEEPRAGMRYGRLRRVVFKGCAFVRNILVRGMGQGKIRIWTCSMWAVAIKTNQR